MYCLLCGKDSKRDNFCRECKEKKQNATAIVSQNKKKLRKLLQESEITLERFEKFIIYSNNIVKYWKVVMEYKEKDTKRTFEKVMKFWILCCRIVSLVFIWEIIIVEI